ncbi:MAG: cytochrome C oxidase subunit IV family protein [Candidatus Eisenbacteria bacterium]|nr:cytochrome C oxidase subunit IV family protein [Candidatus Eisenbacteria bacterium]
MADTHAHEEQDAQAPEHAHPGAREYLAIATILTVITAVEVAAFYIPAMKSVLVPVLLTLSALKFSLVAMFYMHLKFDHRLFSWLFVTPMIVAALVIVALLKLFGHW